MRHRYLLLLVSACSSWPSASSFGLDSHPIPRCVRELVKKQKQISEERGTAEFIGESLERTTSYLLAPPTESGPSSERVCMTRRMESRETMPMIWAAPSSEPETMGIWLISEVGRGAGGAGGG